MNLVGLWQRVSPMAHCLPIPTVMSMRHYVGCLRPKDNENAEQQLKVSRRDIFIRKDERAASASLKKPSSDPSIHHKSASRTLITKLWSRVNASRAVNLIWMCVCVFTYVNASWVYRSVQFDENAVFEYMYIYRSHSFFTVRGLWLRCEYAFCPHS